jgi:hypothetical protein
MTIDKYDKAMSLKTKIEEAKMLKNVFKLEEELYLTNPDDFKKLVLDNQNKIGDGALKVVGETLKEFFNTNIALLEKEFTEL